MFVCNVFSIIHPIGLFENAKGSQNLSLLTPTLWGFQQSVHQEKYIGISSY